MRIAAILRRSFLGLLISLSLIFPGWTWANPERNAQVVNLELFFSQILSLDEFRNHKNIAELNRVSAWLKEQMRRFGVPCEYQGYQVNSLSYRNLICKLNAKAGSSIVVGAHYDVFANTLGANNNASGVVGVLETARLLSLQKNKLKNNIEFVFYTLEEPPYFKTEHMGSYLHAKSLKKSKQKVKGVFVLDSIGYYDENLVQNYPAGLKWIYPKHANFIASIGHLSSVGLTSDFCDAMQRRQRLDCERFIIPNFMHSMDYSGYLNYARQNYPTVLISDTAHYRYPYDHTEQDTLDKLNLKKMTYVIDGLVDTILNL
ncbi:M28 family peptidase [Acinetobacter sp. ANC 7454]|uniref:M28 family peptidase n=1 Tax=Acinetobacter thermotolerans TaxID=3151487 RepID=UPI00325B21BD